jgi:hypothetical protein
VPTDSIPLDDHVHIVLFPATPNVPTARSTRTHRQLLGPQPMVFILAPRLVKSSIEACSPSRSARRALISLNDGTYHYTPNSVTTIATTATARC